VLAALGRKLLDAHVVDDEQVGPEVVAQVLPGSGEKRGKKEGSPMKSEVKFCGSSQEQVESTLTSLFMGDPYSAIENPPHVLGSQPATGSGSDRPTSHNGFGWTISQNVADFSSQVAVVGGSGYEFMGFNPGTTFTSAIAVISRELAVLQTGTDPQANVSVAGSSLPDPVHVDYLADGRVNVYDAVSGVATVGTWTLNQSLPYQVVIDLNADTYDFYMDSTQVLFDRPITADSEILNVSFFRPFDAASYAIDNFRWDIIPEPSTWALMLTASLLFGINALKRKLHSLRVDSNHV
ncbi:MAG: PEP-CTERM sorting domain-containing protein, partial [Verrucomicrobia bacterium]|nr:PEP-CTERM sorting domain-containing protein [Verrucomicrobiota bacterium]